MDQHSHTDWSYADDETNKETESPRNCLLLSTDTMLKRQTETPSPEYLSNTIGALEAGGMVSCLLMGIVTIQVYYYYRKFHEDRVALKIMVAFVWLCELGHSICISHTIYVVTVVYGTDRQIFSSPPKTLSTAIFFGALSNPLIQTFFAWRIKGVAGAWTLTLICWTMSFARIVIGLVSFVEALKMASLQKFLTDWRWSILATIVIGVMNDVLIALSLIWALIQRRGATASKDTVVVIDTLILWTLETGLLTSMGEILMMILFLTMPDNFVWLSVFAFVAKLYSNSLMAVMNGRDTLRGRAGTLVEMYPPNLGAFRNPPSGNTPHTNTDLTSSQGDTGDSDVRFFETSKSTASASEAAVEINVTTDIVISRDADVAYREQDSNWASTTC
ncbi:hypothetical protein PM082_013837 [Marasmius tenuissimus]|nr:hypothetical protein PM082_013837 [Marasmius tenuissimus]